ncbi:SUKH-3 domain-containing protein [Micromonospora sp. NPDC049679]|uniref:SUKH-3 domain-containing protein n=1 Tax=Micromonospora sp. NPDC049679 TaxID=3155920 RepID=UPI0033C1B3B9
MLSRDEIEQIAAVWARRESLHRGYECTPVLGEFDVGYTVYATPLPQERGVPGDGSTTIIDKSTGDIYVTNGTPPPIVVENFRKGVKGSPLPLRTGPRRSAVVATVNPPLTPSPVLRRLPTPGVTAQLTVSGRVHRAAGAKGEENLVYHPLVRDYLERLPPGHLVRGGDRHAELIVISDALYAHDAELRAVGEAPPALTVPPDLLNRAQFELFRVREPGDPMAGTSAHPCESCSYALVHFGVLRSPEPTTPQQSPPAPGDLTPGDAIARVVAVAGATHRHEAFPAAERALAAYPDFVSDRRGVGGAVCIRPLAITPTAVAHTADTLADFGTVLGARLFPIGTEEDDSVLAVDEHGRVFALDQAGEWFLGADIDEALTNLLLGRTVPRVRNDGTW